MHIGEMLAWSGHEPRSYKPVGRPAPASTNIGRLDTRHNKHWPDCNPTRWRCRVCSARVWRERWCSSVLSVTWHFVWTEVVLRITTQKTTYKSSFCPCYMQTVEALTTM
jgi:hypothetical protein